MKRKSWDDFFKNIVLEVSEMSTCCRIHVGAILVKDNRIISIGYNGSPSGKQHCLNYWENFYNENMSQIYPSFEKFLNSIEFYNMHHKWSENIEIHAEQNAIIYAAKSGISTNNAALYATYSPCIHCAKVIAQAGIKEVKYIYDYDRDQQGKEFLQSIDIKCSKI